MNVFNYINTHRRASWLEHFFDLTFVVIFGSIIHMIASTEGSALTMPQIGIFVFTLIPVWWIWASHTIYSNLYDDDSIFNRISTMAIMYLIVLMSRYVNLSTHTDYIHFIYMYTSIRLLLSGLYFSSAFKCRDNLRCTLSNGIIGLIDALIGFTAVFMSTYTGIIVLFLTIVVDIALPAIINARRARVLIDKRHYIERSGLMAIIILGESIIFLAENYEVETIELQSIATTTIGFVFICGLWWYNFSNFEKIETCERIRTHFLFTIPQLFLYMGTAIIASMINFAYTEAIPIDEYKLLTVIGMLLILVGKESINLLVLNKSYRRTIVVNFLSLTVMFLPMITNSYFIILCGLCAGIYTYDILNTRLRWI